MWKQFVLTFRKKSSKSNAMPDPSCSCSKKDFSASDSSAQRTNSSNVASNKSAAATVKKMSSAVFPASVVAGIEPLLSFRDVSNQEKHNLFIAKLNLCCVVFDFNNPSKNAVEKDLKRQVLEELVEYVSAAASKFSEQAIAACCKMFSTNLFRIFPPISRTSTSGGENDDDEPIFDPAWPHLQLIYDLLLNLLSSSYAESKTMKKYMNHSFILGLLNLFDSSDPRERDCLKTILHKIYGKFMIHRPFIRKTVSNIFSRFVSETEKHNGIAELLEIFGSIISGFAMPLKEEHRIFLWRVLIPLHKPKSVGLYSQQLTYCVTQYIEKDPKLASTVLRGLIKYWPVTSSQKEVIFLSEVEEILESTSMIEFQKIMIPLFRRIGCCLSSSHFQVAERALYMWNNDRIMSLIAPNRQTIIPCILPYLAKNTETHWNQAVLNLTLNLQKMLSDMDPELFSACQTQFQEERSRHTAAADLRRLAWHQLESAASSSPPVAGYIPVIVGHLN